LAIQQSSQAASNRPKVACCALGGPGWFGSSQATKTPENTGNSIASPLEERQSAVPCKPREARRTLGISRSVLTFEGQGSVYTKEKLWKNASADTLFFPTNTQFSPKVFPSNF
jgi:hypothetical protein